VIKPDIGDSQLVIDYRQEASNRHSRTGFVMQRLSILHCKYRWHQLLRFYTLTSVCVRALPGGHIW